MVFSIKFMTSCDILYILRQIIIQLFGTISYAFFYQSGPYIEFSVWSCSCLGSVYLCNVTLLYVCILCDVLSVPQGSFRGLLGSDKSLPLFVLLFSTSSVGKLWICNYLEWFLCFVHFGSMCSFLLTSIQVRVPFVSICSFLVLVSLEWRWNSWTRNHVFYHDLAFSNLISFSVVFK